MDEGLRQVAPQLPLLDVDRAEALFDGPAAARTRSCSATNGGGRSGGAGRS